MATKTLIEAWVVKHHKEAVARQQHNRDKLRRAAGVIARLHNTITLLGLACYGPGEGDDVDQIWKQDRCMFSPSGDYWWVTIYLEVQGFTHDHDPRLANVLETIEREFGLEFRSRDHPAYSQREYYVYNDVDRPFALTVEATLKNSDDVKAPCRRVHVRTELVEKQVYEFRCDGVSV